MNPAIRSAHKLSWFRSAPAVALLGGLTLLVPVSDVGGAGARGQEPQEATSKPAAEPGSMEVRFADNSTLKLLLRDERIEMDTPYGKLHIPVADIQKIEFATRIPFEDDKRIKEAIANLGSSQFPLREAASAVLLKQREKAYPALLEAAKHRDPEVVRRAEGLLDLLREAVPEEQLEIRKYDVVHTEHSKLAGRIGGLALKANTVQFGEVQLKLADMRALRSLTFEPEPEATDVAQDPGQLVNLQNQIGKTFAFRVRGALSGAIWGTDVYTLDSTLAMVAVHCGLLQPGQTGVIRVKIVPSPAVFVGSTRHGVTSAAYAAYPAAYQVLKR